MRSDKQTSTSPESTQSSRRRRKDVKIEDQLRAKVAASLADPRKSISASDVFRRLRRVADRANESTK
jgi:hypothetical protein